MGNQKNVKNTNFSHFWGKKNDFPLGTIGIWQFD